MTDIAAFSGYPARCVMCGHNGATAEYLRGIHCVHGNHGYEAVVGGSNDTEWLHRTCDGCGYTWDEQPLTAGETHA